MSKVLINKYQKPSDPIIKVDCKTCGSVLQVNADIQPYWRPFPYIGFLHLSTQCDACKSWFDIDHKLIDKRNLKELRDWATTYWFDPGW